MVKTREGLPCKLGHTLRYVSNKKCVVCSRENSRIRAQKLDKVKHAEDVRKWWLMHPEHKPERAKKFNEWRTSIPHEERRRYANEYHHKRKNDPLYILPLRLRTRLRGIIYGQIKRGSAVHDLGCSIAELKIWLESQFQSSMTWDNYGPVWHIDHKEPLSKFDLTDHAQLLQAVHYTNLQPLFAIDNIRKGGVRKRRTEGTGR